PSRPIRVSSPVLQYATGAWQLLLQLLGCGTEVAAWIAAAGAGVSWRNTAVSSPFTGMSCCAYSPLGVEARISSHWQTFFCFWWNTPPTPHEVTSSTGMKS